MVRGGREGEWHGRVHGMAHRWSSDHGVRVPGEGCYAPTRATRCPVLTYAYGATGARAARVPRRSLPSRLQGTSGALPYAHPTAHPYAHPYLALCTPYAHPYAHPCVHPCLAPCAPYAHPAPPSAHSPPKKAPPTFMQLNHAHALLSHLTRQDHPSMHTPTHTFYAHPYAHLLRSPLRTPLRTPPMKIPMHTPTHTPTHTASPDPTHRRTPCPLMVCMLAHRLPLPRRKPWTWAWPSNSGSALRRTSTR
eukprot:1408283-Rhodomonas_salina.2